MIGAPLQALFTLSGTHEFAFLVTGKKSQDHLGRKMLAHGFFEALALHKARRAPINPQNMKITPATLFVFVQGASLARMSEVNTALA